MEKPPPDKILFFAFLFFAAFFIFSCSEEKIDVYSSEAKVVFDFDEEGAVSQRLSVFVKLSSDARRLENISVINSEYTWNIESPVLFQANKESWAGYMHLEPPSDLKKIPQGKYDFECVSSNGDKAQGKFDVFYDEELLGAEFSEEFFKKERWVHRIAVYSEMAELLYFEEPKEGWGESERVFSAVKNSDFFRNVYERQRTVCIGPKIYKDTPERRAKSAEQDSEENKKEAENEL